MHIHVHRAQSAVPGALSPLRKISKNKTDARLRVRDAQGGFAWLLDFNTRVLGYFFGGLVGCGVELPELSGVG